MPLLKPREDENRAEFIARCMSDENVQVEFDDRDQRLAVCGGIFDRSEGKDMNVNDRLLKAIAARGQKAEPFNYGIHRADAYVQHLQETIGLDRCYRFASTSSVSFTDIMEKAAKTLTYSNPDMLVEEKGKFDLPKGIELPKNVLMMFRHVLTTNRKDRDGDVLHPEGFDVDPKMLLLFQHIHTMPIGKMLAEVDHNTKRLSLISCIVDINELCYDSAVMIDNGMGRFSHGFRAMEFTEIKEGREEGPGGFDITKGEIMEHSLVSVPANVDTETEDVMLSLVEGGKLTSPLMKEVGRGIREHRALTLPVKLDLKVTVNGREVEDEDEPRGGGAEGSEGKPSASKEADDAEKKKKETGDDKVKDVFGGDLTGSWEWVERKLREKAKRYLLSMGINVDENDWAFLVGTWPDHTVACVESHGMGGARYYRINWKMEKDEPEFKGEPVEVKIEVSTEIMEKAREAMQEKAGRTLSKANAAKIGDAKEDVDEAAKTEGVSRPVKALLRQASGKLGSVLASLGSDEGTEEKPPKQNTPTVKEAMALVLSEGTDENLRVMASQIKGLERARKAGERARKFRNFKRRR